MRLLCKIAGFAGSGIMSAGEILGRACSRAGLFVFASNDYPSLIRGGHNVFSLVISDAPVYSLFSKVDLLVALNEESIELHKKEFSEEHFVVSGEILDRFAKEFGELSRNMVAVGAVFGLLTLDFNVLSGVINERFAGKPQLDSNLKAAKAGFDSVKPKFEFKAKSKQLFLSGNHALALGAIKAGMKFAAIYPITPINPMLEYLALKSDCGFVVETPEDEISGILMALGASHCGVRSMVATSGAGFSLMVESLALAGITETPIVIFYGQRAGPATGMPTKTEQSDLAFVRSAGHGEFARIVVAPADVEECFSESVRAFQLAEKFQLPVIVLTDKYLNESFQTVSLKSDVKMKRESFASPGSDFKRYAFTADGISPRSVPGQPDGMFDANSDEHDEFGFSCDSPVNRAKMVEKRFVKFGLLKKELPRPVLYGKKNAKTIIISWGSTKGPILSALEKFPDVCFLQIQYLTPFPDISEFIKGKKVIVIENNKTGQLYRFVKEHCLIEPVFFGKFDGYQFTADQIVEVLDGAK
ncbi:2-oxoglutarate synthase subunit KorA [uncultured archaeon]|nr:2-oxoglutarate synthase subunit KorA [uncultured archaeon]